MPTETSVGPDHPNTVSDVSTGIVGTTVAWTNDNDSLTDDGNSADSGSIGVGEFTNKLYFQRDFLTLWSVPAEAIISYVQVRLYHQESNVYLGQDLHFTFGDQTAAVTDTKEDVDYITGVNQGFGGNVGQAGSVYENFSQAQVRDALDGTTGYAFHFENNSSFSVTYELFYTEVNIRYYLPGPEGSIMLGSFA